MNLLLDTHALLWWLDEYPILSKEARAAISEPANVVFISAAIIWEIRIKQSLGKLKIPKNFREVLEAQPFEMLDITSEHAHKITSIGNYHRDPFDRMLIAQAMVERFTLITRDKNIMKYKVPIIKA
ncbi:MAG: type II toxin-antitoxin system VapC family toxin [Desulfobacteraceae bacterium]|jgi:PIN domain nuclease of toxin-antitoxin system